MATTGICDSYKVELMQTGHCHNAVVSISGTTHTNTTLDGLASTAGIAVGMAITGGDVGAGAVVVPPLTATSVTMSAAASGSSTASRTFTADAFKMALVGVSPSRTYNHTQTNIGTPGSGTPSATNLGTDEASGTGYSSGGMALTNVTPGLPGSPATTATTSFSPSPSLTSATVSVTAAIIYNNSTRLGAAAAPLNGRTVGVYDFGGTISGVNSTITFTMPTNDGTHAIIQLA